MFEPSHPIKVLKGVNFPNGFYPLMTVRNWIFFMEVLSHDLMEESYDPETNSHLPISLHSSNKELLVSNSGLP